MVSPFAMTEDRASERNYNAHVTIGQIEALAAAIAEFAHSADSGGATGRGRALGHLMATVEVLEDRCRELRKTLYGNEKGP
ncbi:MAG: hypothetical protein AB7L90_10260 [Hyphomicrobiaceae bacterium]